MDRLFLSSAVRLCLRNGVGREHFLRFGVNLTPVVSHGIHTLNDDNRKIYRKNDLLAHSGQNPRNVIARSYYKDSLYYNCFSSETSVPIIYTQKLLETIQTTSGLPWWATIVGTTILLKTAVTLPVAVYSQNIAAKLFLLRPEIKEISERWRKVISVEKLKHQWTVSKAKKEFTTKMKSEIRSLYRHNNCHPLKSTAVFWVQLPLWITISFALRNMTGTFPGNLDGLVPGLMTGGVAWFPNLVLIDPLSLMPLMLGVFNLINIELSTPREAATSRLFNVMTHISKILCVIMVLFSAMLPSGMTLYWTTSAGYGLAQNLILKSPAFRRLVGIPKTALEKQKPFRDIANSFLKLVRGKGLAK